jgi:hypothetical protein
MSHQITTWDTPDAAKMELYRRLRNCIEARIDVERGWREAERIVYTIQNIDESGSEKVALGDGTGTDESFTSQPRVSVNTVFKNYRFLHSQMSANPPTVVCRPTSGDAKDHRAADAADRLIRYAIRKYLLQEMMDRANGHALLYGTGFVKTVWNPDMGDVSDFDQATGKVETDGEIDVTVPIPWNIYFDPDAEVWEKVRFVFEKMFIPYESACLMWPGQEDLLQKLRTRSGSGTQLSKPVESEPQPTFLKQMHFDVIEVYQYWEKGTPSNGMQGRFCYCSIDGDLLGDIHPSPFRFAPVKNKLGDGLQSKEFEIALLPYSIMTDIDNPCGVWGRSTVMYQSPLQDIHNALVNTMIENAKAAGVARLLMHEDTAVADDALTNSPYDVVKWTGTRPPEYQPPMQLPAVMNDLIQLMAAGIDNMAGVNEAMQGVQSREQSGFSMQYATNNGNTIRRRLFNKYTLLVESVFKKFLDLVRKNWDVEHTIYVLGKEKAFEALDLKGSDIEGGFDLCVEYGASLSLDPVSRRQELITMLPLFEKAGVDPREILRMVKLSELEGAYDMVELAASRQNEIFDQIIADEKMIAPRDLSDHKGMLTYSYGYVMGAAYRDLDPAIQALIDQHIHAREAMAAKGPNPGAPPSAGGTNSAGTPPGPQTASAAGDLAGNIPPTAGGAPSTGIPDSTTLTPMGATVPGPAPQPT